MNYTQKNWLKTRVRDGGTDEGEEGGARRAWGKWKWRKNVSPRLQLNDINDVLV